MANHRSLVALCALALLVTACNAPAARPKPPQPQPQPAGPITIRLGVQAEDPALDAVIAAFQDRYPEYRVEKVAMPQQAAAFEAAVRTGKADVVPGGGWLAHLIPGPIAELDPYVHSAGFDMAPFEPLLPILEVQGKVYELPVAVMPMVMVANKSLLEAESIALPDGTWTWEQFREAARAAAHTRDGVRYWGFAADDQTTLVDIWVQEATAHPLKQSRRDAVRDAFHFFSDMTHMDRSMPPLDGSHHFGVNVDPKAFAEGRAAFSLLPLEMDLDSLGFDCTFVPMPVVPGGKAAWFVYLIRYAMTNSAENPEAAWKLLQFISGKEGATVRAKVGYLPYYPAEEVRRAWMESARTRPLGVAMPFDVLWAARAWEASETTASGLLLQSTIAVLSGKQPWEKQAAYYYETLQNKFPDWAH